ncbi:hypothetical protein SCHPADRAFT_859814 [Schizopora paradoxa]|uniref:BTB domain-containing protein n=1 Tax=Schizopora paradoxa TaxID=27342 RepID=A0A0H2R8P7_9AGAM|nr:hypothetical protein SCHPADRAFT_859814 [Schizopora paradoxa]
MDVDAEPAEPKGPPQPCEHLWFPDGNVVLATDSLLFKVHKGVLALQSSVFKDMFELPGAHGLGPSQGQGTDVIVSELYEGLPLVTLVGDDGDEVVHLLRTAYEREYYQPYEDDASLDTVVSLLKLSTKYDFKQIRKDVVFHISRYYPMDLKECDEIEENSTIFGLPRARCHDVLLDAAFVAEVDVLLPILYYACADYQIGSILNAMDEESINRKCLRTLLEGREKLEGMIVQLVATIPEIALAGSALTSTVCTSSDGINCLRVQRFTGLKTLTGTASLQRIIGINVCRYLPPATCISCRAAVESLVEKKREEIWDAVPSYFGFPDGGWDALKTKLDEFFAS